MVMTMKNKFFSVLSGMLALLLALGLSACEMPGFEEENNPGIGGPGTGEELPQSAVGKPSNDKVYNRLVYYDLLKSQTDEGIVHFSMGDFDGDGVNEAFATTCASPLPENAEHGKMKLWFLKKDRASLLLDTCELALQGQIWGFEDKKLFCIEEYGAEEFGNRSRVYFVSGNGAYGYGELGSGLARMSGETDEFVSYISAEDAFYDSSTGTVSGITRKPYYFYFDGNFFHEYGGIAMREDQLRLLDGADALLTEISENGWATGSIYYRGNDLVNVNISRMISETVTEKQNVTLRRDEDGVFAAVILNGAEAVDFSLPETFSYGGEYAACGIGNDCEYPEKLPEK